VHARLSSAGDNESGNDDDRRFIVLAETKPKKRVENEMMSMKLVVWGMKTWPLGMKDHAQGTKCWCLV